MIDCPNRLNAIESSAVAATSSTYKSEQMEKNEYRPGELEATAYIHAHIVHGITGSAQNPMYMCLSCTSVYVCRCIRRDRAEGASIYV